MELKQDQIVNFLKNYGFVYQSSEIYNGLANSWDYGPLGALLKNNIKQLLLKHFVFSQPDMKLLDSSIILNPLVWQASGHLDNFSDPLVDCKECKSRYRADKLIEELNDDSIKITENTDPSYLEQILVDKKVECKKCGSTNWTKIRKFNLMFKTFQGVVEDSLNTIYLRPETAQGIFINFKNIVRTQRMKLPFGVAQIGKAFRNEITPGNFIFRTREFEQFEIEYFLEPELVKEKFDWYINQIEDFLINKLLINKQLIKRHEIAKDELAHYSSRTIDFQFNFPHGWSELWGLAHRGNFDLTAHSNQSGKILDYHNETEKTKIIPDVIEPSLGIERILYAIVCAHYHVEQLADNDSREVLRLPVSLSPYQLAILPLVNKLKDQAYQLYLDLLKISDAKLRFDFDSAGSIGKRYRRYDAIGTKYCLTYDFDSLEKGIVTIRERDSMEQIKIPISELRQWIRNNLHE
ncbi:glycyl-tRNA synthetase [Mycoplasmoides gallisepticum CA06_2006.052-5-2P]|uniref:Glycine--tRNA ligase n=1 Tax=Mycoplasmoides gallisepticum WI01_2001.043-13-2P TaxID=1159201 RepID=J3YH37_MYCGL|nr:glycine--tRNA ligase [Mycoplasmoides gallisepticum]AFP75973.1 glycyl-tRNA synthetase [Mycoplasmoides gallisepticum VA94_7994-1-7P]AFP76740.1 glycyl-tRNA synthetase [Mycoplasmoides gallisepticum NC95_13295-2-2P]AFP77494.1 glycyl-tRNA synthetase [Mycoplasmoides gallisepticum NC96_1596-4-2P]AFP78265.1 glycyl-tRNA synthetase [Mycoplasmoides gallisepticum NY01_2001.047-5-1P]AFP79025.1 glycyl-tRNA synthetase [Mycoplasmoides gallisepticum WI01_2001.043-13-2P]